METLLPGKEVGLAHGRKSKMSEFLTTLGIIVALFLSIYNFYNSYCHIAGSDKNSLTPSITMSSMLEKICKGKRKEINQFGRESGIIMRLSHTPYAARSPMTSPMIT